MSDPGQPRVETTQRNGGTKSNRQFQDAGCWRGAEEEDIIPPY